MYSVIGIDMGGTKCAVIHGKTDGNEISVENRVSFPTGIHTPPDVILDKICAAVRDMKTEFEAIGISCGGPLDAESGTIMSPPNLPLWDNIHICDRLTEEFGVPAYLQNDANACALAEWQFGAGKGTENMVFMTFGTGLGAGLILDGRLYGGKNGMAGELGHIRLSDCGPSGYGKSGSFEGFCSGRGIAQLGYTLGMEAFQRGEKPSYFNPEDIGSCTAKSIGIAAEKGDATAIKVYETSGEYLGRGLSVIIDILNPERIVIGSIFARSYDYIWPAAKRVIEREALSYSRRVCEVVPAGLGEKIGDLAAIAVAIYNGGKNNA